MKYIFNTIKFIFFISVFFSLACSKEQKQADILKGKWQITQLSISDTAFVSDTLAKQYFEFFACEKAYTATCEGVYFAESLDETKFKSIRDTFKYNVNADNFTITKVKTNEARFLLRRFEMKKIDSQKLEFGNDTLILKANKL
ncbi:MAG: hypothetical protein V4667_07985 [Bacteroidota bacterium]